MFSEQEKKSEEDVWLEALEKGDLDYHGDVKKQKRCIFDDSETGIMVFVEDYLFIFVTHIQIAIGSHGKLIQDTIAGKSNEQGKKLKLIHPKLHVVIA